ncbi:DnaJ sub C member 4 [Bulinus truncatus]|nr:DnaJ sub C member 4 [Bulinus truncatus]
MTIFPRGDLTASFELVDPGLGARLQEWAKRRAGKDGFGFEMNLYDVRRRLCDVTSEVDDFKGERCQGQRPIAMITSGILFHHCSPHIALYYKGISCCNHVRHLSAMINHYKVLGLDRSATAVEIRDAFISKSKECHPDRNVNKSAEHHQQFILVKEAYSVLSKPQARHIYDLTLQSEDNRFSTSNPDKQAQIFYEHPRTFHDTYSYKINQGFKKRPYYGIPGVQRMSNGRIVFLCLGFMLTSIVLHFMAVRHRFSTAKKILDENDKKIYIKYQSAKESAAELALNKKQASLNLNTKTTESSDVPKS